jgi:hypothetical protein
MDVGKVLVELREELDILNAAITGLERLQHVGPRKRAAGIRKFARQAARRGGARTVAEIRKPK